MSKTLAVVIAIVFVLIPYPSLDAPEWSVLVIDNQQMPLTGILVRESYQNYSYETSNHEIDLVTGDDGKVLFPAKAHWRSLLFRALGTIEALNGGVHASFGPHDYVTANSVSPEKNGYIYDWTGRPPKVNSVIKLR